MNDRRDRLPTALTGGTRHLHFHNRGADPRQTCWASTFKHNWHSLTDIQAIYFLPLMFFGSFSQRLRISDFSLFESQRPLPNFQTPQVLRVVVEVVRRYKKKHKRTQTFAARRTRRWRDNQLLMMSVTKSRAAWVRGVKFSTHVVHAVKKTIKMPTVVLPATLIFTGKRVQNVPTLPNTQSSTVATINIQQKCMQHLLFCSSICWRIYVVQVVTIILHRRTNFTHSLQNSHASSVL